jgi:hypothetical protein
LQYLLLPLPALMLFLPFVPQHPGGVAIFLTDVCAVLGTAVLVAGVTRPRLALALALAISSVACLGALPCSPCRNWVWPRG